MASDSPAAGNAASPEVAKRPAIIPGKFQDHAEAAWDAWYEPEHDIARFMVTSPYDKMREAFAGGFAAGIKTEREQIISLASQLRASFPADHPKGAQASFADYLRVTAAERGGNG